MKSAVYKQSKSILPLLLTKSLQQIPIPPSPIVHLFAFLENRYLEEHSTNDLHFLFPVHPKLEFGLIPGAGVGLGFNAGGLDSNGHNRGEQCPYSR